MLTEEQRQRIQANREQALIRLRAKKEQERLEAVAPSSSPPQPLSPSAPLVVSPQKALLGTAAPSISGVYRVTWFSPTPSAGFPPTVSSQPERPKYPPTTPPKRTGMDVNLVSGAGEQPSVYAPSSHPGPSPPSSARVIGKEEEKEEKDSPQSVVEVIQENPTMLSASQARLALFSRRESGVKRPAPEPLLSDAKKMKAEERFRWLEEVRDAKGRKVNDAEYDPRTLFIPRQAWDRFTPFERQYWKVKAIHFDSVVFFQKGKFYELYENDAGMLYSSPPSLFEKQMDNFCIMHSSLQILGTRCLI